MSANKIPLRIVTPKRVLFDREVDMVVLKGSEGDIGVLKGHEPLTISLEYGLLRILNGENELIASLLGGFAEITPEKLTILTDAAEWPEEIDIDRAEDARERAKRRLKTESDIDLMRAELSLRRALVRLEVSHYKQN